MTTIYHINLFGLELTVDRVAFTLPFGENGWPIYWYGILISLGFLLALIYGLRNATRLGVDPDRLIDCVLVSTLFSIAGARAYYVIFSGEGIAGLKNFFDFRDGGLAIYGGIIFAALVGAVMCRLRKIPIADTLDLVAPGFLIGQAIGRWGNFFNQEAFGSYIPDSSFLPDWFGMSSEATAAYYSSGVMVHPCFLYESLWCLIGFVLLHLLSKRRVFSGQVALSYGVWYGLGRFFIEGLRTDSLFLGNFRVSQVVSALLVITCATLLILWSIRPPGKRPLPEEYVPMFTPDEALAADEAAAPVADLEDTKASTEELSMKESSAEKPLSQDSAELFSEDTAEEQPIATEEPPSSVE